MNGAVYSMTGFATSTSTLGTGQTITIDIRSVNSRFLDLSFKLPDSYRHLETLCRERISKTVKRGKCEVRLSYQNPADGSSDGPISRIRIQHLLAQQSEIHAFAPHASALSVAEIISLSSQQTPTPFEAASDAEVLALMQTVLSDFMQTREREGSQLVAVMLTQTQALRGFQADVRPLIPTLIEQQRQRFLQKFSDAISDGGNKITAAIAEERALSEATAFAIRADVQEEVDRMGAHLNEIEALLSGKSDNPQVAFKQGLGKRLEFLIQELHREANTLGSKSAALQTTSIAIEMKVLIEQLREQVQNIE
jgi:uncharacterized protein (TIGR00255 family)